MTILILILIFLLLAYFCLERWYNDRCLRSFKAVIHVNGIRGKTSTCRMIDAVLRTRYKTFTKTTGTDAAYIDAAGNEHPVRRFGSANLHEQLRMIRKAHREGAEVLILECMAVSPQLQLAAQKEIVKAGIGVITNVRYDHVFEMGDTLEEIAASLSATIPDNGTLFSGDPNAENYFGAYCDEKHTRLISCSDTSSDDPTASNRYIALSIGEHLGVSPEEGIKGLKNVHTDFGQCERYDMISSSGKPFSFLNLFSVNDPLSTETNIQAFRKENQPVAFLYQHRSDRPDRALLFARYFLPSYKECPVYVCGKGAGLAMRIFRQAGAADVRYVKNPLTERFDLPEGSLLAGIGNIKGPCYKLIETLENNRRKEDTSHE